MAREAWPLTLALAVLAAVLWWVGWTWAAAAALLAVALVLAFFRDPHRSIPPDAAIVVAPADGRVVEARPADRERRAAISIFLSIFNVHITRAPVSGEVVSVERTRGGFRAAFRDQAGAENERVAITIRSRGGDVVCTQVAGFVARRIVCRARPGDQLEAGQRYGLIQFGSRMDLDLPAGTVLLVERGDRTRAGLTPVARLGEETGA